VQYIDVRDLAAWIVAMSSKQQTGTYNATGPDYELRLGKLLEECEAASGSDAKLVWVSEEFLEQNGVEAFTELPLWVPREYGAMLAVDCGRAIEAGLAFRPLSETIRDVLEWDSMRTETDLAAGLKPERERELLSAWHGGNL
jgi:2'-hydroxyisoflavone reductase